MKVEHVQIMETETIDKLFLELAQFTTATTPREQELRAVIRDLMPWLREPGQGAPTARLEYQKVVDRAQRVLSR